MAVEIDEALTVLARVPGSFAADGLAARITLESAARNAAQPPVPDLSELDRRMGRLASLGYQGVELSACHPMPHSVIPVSDE